MIFAWWTRVYDEIDELVEDDPRPQHSFKGVGTLTDTQAAIARAALELENDQVLMVTLEAMTSDEEAR